MLQVIVERGFVLEDAGGAVDPELNICISSRLLWQLEEFHHPIKAQCMMSDASATLLRSSTQVEIDIEQTHCSEKYAHHQCVSLWLRNCGSILITRSNGV